MVIFSSHQNEDDRVEEVVELTAEEMSARQAAAEEIMKRNKEKEGEIDEAADQLTELVVQEKGGAAWENQSMSQMSKLSSTSCRYQFIKTVFFSFLFDF